MRKRFRGRKKRISIFKLKYLFFIFLIYISCNTTYSFLVEKNIKIDNESFLKLLMMEGNHHLIYKYKPKKIINEIIAFLSNIDINKPATILGINLLDKEVLAANNYIEEEHIDFYNPNDLEKITDYIKDPNPSVITNPRVYIYNTHQLENYNTKHLEIYNIRPNVMMASYMLKEKLNNLGIPTIVEEANITEFMRINHWKHADSYKASRIFILDAKNKYDTLEYYIDIHRDSVRRDHSTVKINGKNYARTLLLVGLDNPNYTGNLKVVEEINKIIEKRYPSLSRGILKKQGAGVDGVYNQDISPKMILLEVGGVDNNIEDVLNTIEAFSKVFYEYLEGER